MEIRFQNSPQETKQMDTAALRSNFLLEQVFSDDKGHYVYSHYDRAIVGGIKPVNTTVALENDHELRAEYFLERREIGIINVGGKGTVRADGNAYEMEKLSCVYLGKGTKEVSFASDDSSNPALYFFMSVPAHHQYPNRMMTKEEAAPVNLGSPATSNERTIYKYIHLDGIASCQLVMGLTVLKDGSVWNSVPPHTHTRRMEAYFYFDVPDAQRVFHFMGEPRETRNLIMSNHQAVLSPPWSVHFGCGTANYAFIWAMAGENQVFTDMDPEPIAGLK
ncbi:MAG TPA: 5-dehydro-4-deoxy-D-glucuronate isomerase [Phnomibacter sp.]|nr:5-dehydro-4-deoxy-D-glucuronate isomerase [Phnomibacter sp.]